MPVREFVKSDVEQVVSLYWNYLAERAGPVPTGLRTSLTDLYFANPLSDASPSWVYEDVSADIRGFLGVTTRTMLLSGRPIRVGFAGNFVVHPKARSGVAAPALLDAYIAGDQDLQITDTANNISRHLMHRLRFRTIPELNIHWARPLRPCQYLLHALSHRLNAKRSMALRRSAKPLCVVADLFARKAFAPVQRSNTRLQASELTVEALLDCLVAFRQTCVLRAQYNVAQLQWLLSFMARNNKRGSLRRVLLKDENCKTVGWYLYYAKSDGIGEVVQIGGAPDLFHDIFSHLLTDAQQQGVVAVHGRADFRRLAELSDGGCFFTCRGGWTLVFSRQAEILNILRGGQEPLSRLDGEWCLDPGE